MNKTMDEIRDLADCIPGYTVVYKADKALKRVYYSANLPSLTGHTREEYEKFENEDPFTLIIQGDRQNVKEKFSVALKSHESIDMAYRLVHKTGKLVWVRLHGNYIGDVAGEAIYLASIYDVTDEWESKNIILDASDRAVVVFDKFSKSVLYGNIKFFDIVGKAEAECLGRPCYDVVCGIGMWDEKKCICFKAIHCKEPMINYNSVNDRYYSITASETMWGEHPAIIFFMSDVTDEKKKDIEIKKKNNELHNIQKEAIRAYRHQIEAVMKMNPDALSTYRFNLTKNMCLPGTSRTDFSNILHRDGTVDGYFRHGVECMDENDRRKLDVIPNAQWLLDAYSRGENTVTRDAHYHIGLPKEIYVRTTVTMAENPITHDIEGVMYTRDITQQKLQMDILERLMENTYESISIINLETRQVEVMKYKYDSFAEKEYQNADYRQCVEYFVNTYVEEDDRKTYKEYSELSHIINMLNKDDKYSFVFHFKDDDSDIRIKTITFLYQDDRKKTILGFTHDITDIARKERDNIKQLKEALLIADKATEAKNLFFSNISHDMRTPLNGILGFADLGMNAKTLEEEKEYISRIKLSGQFLLKLINDTLDMSKMESGRMELRPEIVSGEEVVKEIIYAVEETAKEKNIELITKYPKDTRMCILVDKLRVQQIFTNLVGNSIKFTPEGGKVEFIIETIHDDSDKCNFKITVRDSGIGMKEEFIPHAFEAFSQQEDVATEKVMGTGLGLSIVKQIVDMMDGRIELYSKEGKGTMFIVYLPIKQVDNTTVEKTEEEESINLIGKHILLCEDHPINMELACKLLELKGIEVTSAFDGKKGVDAFCNSEEGFFDAVLMDIRMPQMDGLEAAAAIRKLNRKDAMNVPIIAMTANAFTSDKAAAIAAGMNAHISKPIDPKLLFETLSEYISNRV